MPSVRVGGADLFYTTVGAGPPMVLVHGAPGTDHTWFFPGIRALADHRRLIAYDHVGHGRSGAVDATALTLARLVDDLEGLRRALGLADIHILGHSFGGFIALMYALAYPRTVAGLILVGTASSIRVQDASAHTVRALAPSALIRAREHLWNGTLDGTIKTDDELREAFERALPLYYYRRDLAPRSLPDMIFRMAPRRVLTVREVPRYHIDDRLADIATPTLVTVGRHDLITPIAASERLVEAIPGATLAVFEESGHMPFAEESARFAETVDRFLRGVGSPRREAPSDKS